MIPVRMTLTGAGTATPWKVVDYYRSPVSLVIACVATGTVNYTVQYTYDDLSVTATPTTFNDASLAAATATGETVLSAPATGWRVFMNSGTGSLAITGIQAGPD